MDYGTYREDVLWKPYSKVEPMRTGTLLGARRHNPQPSEVSLSFCYKVFGAVVLEHITE